VTGGKERKILRVAKKKKIKRGGSPWRRKKEKRAL